MIRIAFRFDDPSPVSKRHVEERLFEQFMSRQIPLTCAVIPARMRAGHEIRFTRESAAPLRQAIETGLVDVALHGFLHRDGGLAPAGGRSEFAGVAPQRQREWISTGRVLLEETLQCRIAGFVPPWNSYDDTTLRVLEDMAFDYLSAEMSRPPRWSSTLRILPATCVLGELEATLSQAGRFEAFEPVIVVVMHHYDFERDPDDPPYRIFSQEELGAWLDRLRAMPGVEFHSLRDLSGLLGSGESRFWGRQLAFRDILPHRYKHLAPKSCLLTRWLPLRARVLT